MDIFAAFATDEAAETEGTWIKLGDAKFKIARAYNSNFNRVFSKRYREQEEVLKTLSQKEAEDLSTQLMADCMAETILVGWEGKVEFRGSAVGPYSVAAAKNLLVVKDFRAWVSKQADNIENFKAKAEAETQKN